MFDDKLLDMLEFGVKDYKSLSSFQSKSSLVVAGSKPLMVFQGAAFEGDERMKRAKSLLLDFFGGVKADQVVLKGLDTAIVCSTIDAPKKDGANVSGKDSSPEVLIRRFRIVMTKSGSRLPRVELDELGPRFTLALDRVKEPDRERWKQAIKVPKAAKETKVKNISKDAVGKRHARIHLGQQNVDQIHTVHHGISKQKKLKKDLKESQANE